MTSPHKTWVLTGSVENFRATRERGFELIGAKEGRRNMAEQIEPGDEIVFYVTGVQAFGGIVRVTSEMFEDREKVWPGKPGKVDPYPWRFTTEPVQVLEEDAVRAGRRARGRARPHREVAGRPLAPGLPGPAAHRVRGRRAQARRPDRDGRQRRAQPRLSVLHRRHFTLEEANAAIPWVQERIDRLRDAREGLNDEEARAALSEAGPGNGGGEPGRVVSDAFMQMRTALIELREQEIVLRDLDRGLADFPSLRDDEEVYLCWEEGEDEIGFWHGPDAGFDGRQALDDW